jgi:hypothetical protein
MKRETGSGRTLGWRAVLACLVLGWLGSAAGVTAAPPARPASRPGDVDGTTGDVPIREQSIYIPYTKLRETFEREGRGVFLPYGEFEKLWRAARDKTAPPPESAPPLPFLISEVENEATVGKDVVGVKARVKIELLADGWQRVPLGLVDAAITRAMIGDKPARLVFDAATGYALLISREGKAAPPALLELEYAKAYDKAAGRNSVSFQPPRAPVSRWLIHIPESGVKVDISPLIAATQAPAEGGGAARAGEQTTVLAFVGAAPSVQIAWTPKTEGATGLASLATVQAEQEVRIDDGVMRTRTRLAYEISRAALSELLVEVPADQRVINVVDANVRQWSVLPATASAPAATAPAPGSEPRQRIAIQLFEPASSTQTVVVELEKFVTDAEQRRLRAPAVAAIGAGRQQGIVVVAVAEGLRCEVVARTGLMQLDAGELPGSLAASRWLLSYRYAALPFDLTLEIEKVLPRVTADTLVEAVLEPEQLTLDVLTIYTVERAGVFRLEYDLPAGYSVAKVAGLAIAEAQPAQIDSHHADGPERTHLAVNLASKAIGRVALVLRLERRLSEPDLLTPTGRTAEIPLGIPRVAPPTVERATGRLVVQVRENLRVNPAKVKGLRTAAFKEAYEGVASLQDKSTPGMRPVLAFTYAGEDVGLSLGVERRKPQVTVRQLLVARIEAGVIRYSATFNYDILYSGVPSLRIDVPRALAQEIHNSTPGLRERAISPPPADAAPDEVAWNLVGEAELTGQVQVRLDWEKKIDELTVGRTVELALPRLKPRLVDRAWGQIVWTKAEALDVHESGDPQGVRPIDPQHDLVADGANAAPLNAAARAFEFHGDWDLRVAITRYRLEEVKRTSIERAVLQMVATRSNQTSVRALYRLRSAGQRLALRLPASVEFDNAPVRLNGRPVALERGEAGSFFVPLVGITADTPLLLELRYSVPGGGMRFEPPVFPSEPAVQKVYLCAYMPEERAWLGSKGPWSDEMDWDWSLTAGLRPVPRHDVGTLVNWVREDISGAGGAAGAFQTDGRLYVFSTLHPTETGDASLRLVSLNDKWLAAIVFAVVAGAGLVLLRAAAAARLLAVGGLLTLLILSGAFLPTFSRHLMSTPLMSAVAVVLILWAVRHLGWVRPHRLALARASAAPPPISAPQAPAPDRTTVEESKGGEHHA